MKSLLLAIAIAATTLLSGCAPVLLVGAGVGAGAFSYVAGNLTRVYEADYQQSIKASTNVMEQLSFKRKEQSDNELKTIIEGYLYYDTQVTIEVVYIDDGWTKIGVRTGYYGIDNLEKSEQVHTDIAEELKTLKQRTLKAISQQRKGKSSESKPETSRIQYEAVSPPPETDSISIAILTDDTKKIKQEDDSPSPAPEADSASTASLTDDTPTFKREQENLFLFPNESKTKTFIYYPKSTIAIPPGSYVALDAVVSQLIENPSAKVDIQGYTDSSGSKMKNLAVSYERAYEIQNYLIEKGISEGRITAQGLGATNFLESNRTERLRTMNRRVEITIR